MFLPNITDSLTTLMAALPAARETVEIAPPSRGMAFIFVVGFVGFLILFAFLAAKLSGKSRSLPEEDVLPVPINFRR